MWWHRVIIPELWRERKEDSWGLLASQTSLLGKFQAKQSRGKNRMAQQAKVTAAKPGHLCSLHKDKRSQSALGGFAEAYMHCSTSVPKTAEDA